MNHTIPEFVDTDYGRATVGVVRERNAWKRFLCPLCDESIEVGELHVVVVPLIDDELRRHIHKGCLIAWLAHSLTITLHPFGNPKVKQHKDGEMSQDAKSDSPLDPGGS